MPQERHSEGKTRSLTTCVIAWSVLRIFQCWNAMYSSRQFLGMSLLISGYTFEAHMFVPFALIMQFLFIEIVPFLFVLDQNFLDKVNEKATVNPLTEPLFEQQQPRSQISQIDISQDFISRPQSYEHNSGQLFSQDAKYSPNQFLANIDE